jgi:hypothetical protein
VGDFNYCYEQTKQTKTKNKAFDTLSMAGYIFLQILIQPIFSTGYIEMGCIKICKILQN